MKTDIIDMFKCFNLCLGVAGSLFSIDESNSSGRNARMNKNTQFGGFWEWADQRRGVLWGRARSRRRRCRQGQVRSRSCCSPDYQNPDHQICDHHDYPDHNGYHGFGDCCDAEHRMKVGIVLRRRTARAVCFCFYGCVHISLMIHIYRGMKMVNSRMMLLLIRLTRLEWLVLRVMEQGGTTGERRRLKTGDTEWELWVGNFLHPLSGKFSEEFFCIQIIVLLLLLQLTHFWSDNFFNMHTLIDA